MSGNILFYENVTVRYRGKPEPAVAELTLPVPEGKVTAVAGGSGERQVDPPPAGDGAAARRGGAGERAGVDGR